MGEKVSTFLLGFDGEVGDINSVLAALKANVRSTVADIESTTKRVKLFDDLEKQTQSSFAALDSAKQKVSDLTAELNKAKAAGTGSTTELQSGLKAAETAVASATREVNRNVDALTKQQGYLSRAGVDTKNLAAETTRLADASKAAATAQTNQAAQQLLGLKTVRDTLPEIQRLNAAYGTLSASGTLSSKELAVAQAQLKTKIAETSASVTGLGTASASSGPSLVAMFSKALLPALGLSAGIGGVLAVMSSTVTAARDYQQELARIGSVSTLTNEQLAGLGRGARDLAQEVGIDLNEALKGLYELIRSGVPPSNALEVLKVSAEAAKAATTDTSAGVKAANLLISAYGASVEDLAGDFDILVQSQARGGATLKEFSESAGPLLNTARAANIGLQDLIATLGVMVNASGDASASMSDLQKIIVRLGEPGVRAGLRELGIDTSTLVKTFQGIAASGQTVDQIINIGVASGKSAAGIAALTTNAQALAPSLAAAGDAAGTVAQKVADLYNSPKERSERFNAALHETAVTFGLLLGSGSGLQALTTNFFEGLNKANTELADRFNPAAKLAKERLDEMAASTKNATAETAAFTAKLTEQRAELQRLTTDLEKQIGAIQAGATRDLADLNARADAQIAALDRSKAAEIKTTAETIAIRQKLADDSYVVFANADQKITTATAAAVAARLKLGKEAGQSQADFDAKIAQLQFDGIAQRLAAYQTYYKTLQEREQGYLSTVETLGLARKDFNEGIERKITEIRTGALTGFEEQYLAFQSKLLRIDELTQKARELASTGQLDLAKKYAEQAIALTDSIKNEVVVNGVVILNSKQAQITAIDKVKEVQNILNAAFDAQGKSAKAGADATKTQMESVAEEIKRLQGQYDGFKKIIEEGLKVRVIADEDSIAKANAEIDKIIKERTAVIKVEVQRGGTGSFDGGSGATGGFWRGGLVGAAAPFYAGVQHLAGGGPLFPAASWSKVPGSGDGDTVPASLPVGSFVMRKAASQKYGDGLMSVLARAFATGGGVNFGSLLGRAPLLGGSGGHYEYPDPRWVDNWQREAPTDATDGQKLQAIRGEADGFFAKLLSYGYGLPHSPFGDLSDYIRRAQKKINLTDDPSDAITLLEAMKAQSDTFITTFRGSQLFHVPAVQPVNAVGLDDLDALKFGTLGKAMDERLANRKKRYGFAGGGDVDNVDALLTPGEWVLRPEAVSAINRRWGGGFLHALNAMEVPQMFRHGGPVQARGSGARTFAAGGDVELEDTSTVIRDGLNEIQTAMKFYFEKAGIDFKVNPSGGGGTSVESMLDAVREMMSAWQYYMGKRGIAGAGAVRGYGGRDTSDGSKATTDTLWDGIGEVMVALQTVLRAEGVTPWVGNYGGVSVDAAGFLNGDSGDAGPTSFTDLRLALTNMMSAVQTLIRGKGFYQNTFGGGGVVNALLKAGEFVLQSPAVSNIRRMFGGGFLDALNAMQAPQVFHNGGAVMAQGAPLALYGGGAVGSSAGSTAKLGTMGWPGGDMNVYIQTNEPLSDDYLRRTVLPFFDKLMTKTRARS